MTLEHQSPGDVRVWLNPAAGHGRGEDLARRVLDAATQRGGRALLLPNQSGETAFRAAEAAVAEEIDRLVIIGGDGTIHQAIQLLARTPVVLGVLPAGTGNDFATTLGIPSEIRPAIERALGPPAPVDLLRVGDRFAATIATIGFSVDVSRRARSMRWPRGSARYTAATLLEIGRMRQYPLTLNIDGHRLDVSPNLAAFANTATFGGGMRIAPEARVDSGTLDVVLIGPVSRTAMLRLLPSARRGRKVDAMTVHRGATVTIQAEETFEVWADGEFVGSTPTEIAIVPDALQLAGVG